MKKLKETSEKTDKVIVELQEALMMDMKDFLGETKSPIEKLFLSQSLLTLPVSGWAIYQRTSNLPFEWADGFDDVSSNAEIDFYGHPLIVIPQFKVDKFLTVDFLFYVEDLDIKLIVECDGHDFHEKTKEQAKKDKQRDRYLITSGFYVLRFTGSEIWND